MIKELKEALRDKRTLNMLLMFVFMYPALVGFMLHNQIEKATKTERTGIDIVKIMRSSPASFPGTSAVMSGAAFWSGAISYLTVTVSASGPYASRYPCTTPKFTA